MHNPYLEGPYLSIDQSALDTRYHLNNDIFDDFEMQTLEGESECIASLSDVTSPQTDTDYAFETLPQRKFDDCNIK